MALPTSIDYASPVPPRRPLPTSRADWALEPARAAVLVHDLQRYFTRPYAPGSAALGDAVAATAAVLDAARRAGVPVLYTAQRGDQDPLERGLQRELWGRGMSSAPQDTEILPEVAPQPGDTVLVKHRYSAFARSDLAARLAAAGRDQLVLTGVYAHIGITATALDAFQREVRPFLVADAVADLGAEQHARTLDHVAACCGVVTTADDVVRRLEAAALGSTLDGADDDELDVVLRSALARVLPPEVVERAFAQPGTDLFELGLSSLVAFELLDDLADSGLDVDFGDFTRRPTIEHLRERGHERDAATAR
ncbi:isochorismatase family protein [Cellulomonas sp. HZM]|uniref:isochorismatase family protein n=1 Tax=Cellulomonas sp. HZM TaxID=1454010 RepID=UPI0009DEEEA6|nr:isochorismatase family protein [Cellulomonas sp. HZM]